MARNTIRIATEVPTPPGETSFLKKLVKIGVCSKQTEGRFLFAAGEYDKIEETLGEGPLAEAVRLSLENMDKEAVVVAYPVALSAAGTAGAVTHAGTGAATYTVSGKSFSAYDVLIKITKAASLAQAKYQLSLDGGRTFARETTFPSGGGIVIENHQSVHESAENLKITFVNASTANRSFVEGDTYSFSTPAAKARINQLAAKIREAAIEDPHGNYHVAQTLPTVDWPPLAAVVNELRGGRNLIRLTLEAAPPTRSQSVSAWALGLAQGAKAVSSDFVSISAAFGVINHSSRAIKPAMNLAAVFEAFVTKAAVFESVAWVAKFPLPCTRMYPRESGREISEATKILLGFLGDRQNSPLDPVSLPALGISLETLIRERMILSTPTPEIQDIAVDFEGAIENLNVVLKIAGIGSLGILTIRRRLSVASRV